MCSLGELRSRWKQRFVSPRSTRHLRERDRSFSTLTRDRSLPVQILLVASKQQGFASVGMAEAERWTTFSWKDCADAHAFSSLEESNPTEAKVGKALPYLAAKAKGDRSMERKRSAGG